MVWNCLLGLANAQEPDSSAEKSDVEWQRDPAALRERCDMVVSGRVDRNEKPPGDLGSHWFTVNVVDVQQVLKGPPVDQLRVRGGGGSHAATSLAHVGSSVVLCGALSGEYFQPLTGTPFSFIRSTPDGLANGSRVPMVVMDDGTFSAIYAVPQPVEVVAQEVNADGTTSPVVISTGPHGIESDASLQQVESGIEDVVAAFGAQ